MGDAGDVALSRLDLDGGPAGPLRAQAQFAQIDLFAERYPHCHHTPLP